MPLAGLAERYLTEHVEVRCKPRTVEACRWLVKKFVIPDLGKMAIDAVDREHIAAVTAIRLLMLTGCRLSEIQTLPRENVKLEAAEIRLRDGKTGARMVSLSGPAASVLSARPRPEDNPWAIVGRKPGAHLTDLPNPWCRIRARADLDDVRIHELRHSLASRALALGESLPMIGKLFGHTQVQTTARYAHLANESVKASGSRVGDSIGAHIAPTEPRLHRRRRRRDRHRYGRDGLHRLPGEVRHRVRHDPDCRLARRLDAEWRHERPIASHPEGSGPGA